MNADHAPWWPCGPPRLGAALRLVCFPYAGGGASVYRAWRRMAPAAIDVCPVQLPGREARLREQPYRSLEALAEALVDILRPHVGVPYALFGHSMGAHIAFELAHRLPAHGLPGPAHLFVSAARPAHHRRRGRALHALPDADLKEALRGLKGTPEAILAHDELMELVLPVLRADLEVCETWEYRDRGPLGCPITAFGGSRDPDVHPDEIPAWGELTRAPFAGVILPGDHFFLEAQAAEILRRVAEAVPQAQTAREP